MRPIADDALLLRAIAFAADRHRDQRRKGEVADRPAKGWSLERRREYLDWSERVVAGCRGVNPALEAKFDEELRRARGALAA